MTVPAHVLAAVRSIPHPRQEPDMTAPAPSPAEQEVIDRFGIFEPEVVVETVARAICEADYENVGRGFPWAELDEGERRIYRRLAAAAIAAMKHRRVA